MKLKDLKIKYYKGKPPRIKEGASLLAYLTPDFIRKGTLPEYFPVQSGVVCVEDNDLILLWDGSNAGEFFRAKKGILSSTMVKFDKIEKVTEEYFYYSLKLQEQTLKSKTAGSGIPHVDKEALLNLEVYLPKKPQQAIIATILTTIDQAIEKTEQLIAKYERIKTGLMQDLLTRGIDEQGNIRSEETHEFKDSPLGRIPMEWDVKNIGQITEYVGSGVTPKGGSTVYQNSGVILIRSQNVLSGELSLNDVAHISEIINNSMLRSEIFENDVLLNITGASIGRCCIVPNDFPRANVNQHVCVLRLFKKEETKATFLSIFLNSYWGQSQIARNNAGSNREGLNYTQIKAIELPFPNSDDEFKRIFKVLNSIEKVLKNHKAEYKKLNRQKSALMQDLLTGKVCVNDLTLEIGK